MELYDDIATERGIPLVHCEDYWGCHVRAQHEASLCITVDQLSKKLLHDVHPNMLVEIAGFAGITPIVPTSEEINAIEVLRCKTKAKIIVYPDGGPKCDPALPVLVQSILQSKEKIILILKFHPKFKEMSHPDGGTWDQWCYRVLEPLSKEGGVVDIAGRTDALIELSDGVVSGYSSTLIRTASVGKFSLTLWTPIIAEGLMSETGLSKTPLMLKGGYPVLSQVQSLDEWLNVAEFPKYDIDMFNPKIAANAIEKLTQ